MPKKLKKKSKYLEYLIRCELPRCRICNHPLIATCDRSKPSQLVHYKGREETKTKPQYMWVFPTAEEQSSLCPYCESKLHSIKVGKES
jgi:hypothetical protein